MGNDSRYSGEIQIVPPLTWAQVQAAPAMRDLGIRKAESVVNTETGQATTIIGAAVRPVMSSFSGYQIKDDLQKLVDAFPAHAFVGHIEAWPEDSEPPWRHVVRDRRAAQITAQVVWWEPLCGFGNCPVGCPDPACQCACHLPRHDCVPFGAPAQIAADKAVCPGCIAEKDRAHKAGS